MKTIEVVEDFQVPGTEVILEKGDLISIKEVLTFRDTDKIAKDIALHIIGGGPNPAQEDWFDFWATLFYQTLDQLNMQDATDNTISSMLPGVMDAVKDAK